MSSPDTNSGWVFTEPGAPLQFVELPEPVPGPGQVVIEVAAAGLCHSDVSIMAGLGGDWCTRQPIVLGHEVAGVIRELGPDVPDVAVGDRVAIALLAHDVPAGREPSAPGLSRDGGYERRALAHVDELVRVPDGVGLAQAAMATDSIATSYHAVMTVGRVSTDTVVVIIGLGGLGLNAAQIAVAAGATVHGVDISAAARARAKELGVVSVHRDARELVEVGPEVVCDFAGFGDTTAAAVEIVRPFGTVVVVGLGKTTSTISTNILVRKNARVLGSAGASKNDLVTVLQLIREGTISTTIEEIGLARLPEGLQRLAAGQVTGRLVVTDFVSSA